ncbi:MAG: 30S ribosomal protein S2 [Candidatus Tyloplasma litorale]|nr:MAG: 30S ribosomal protein S2 [Mycoplasmatales bacterium]
MKPIISKDKLLESGLQYGHQTRSWDPAMKPYIQMSKRGIHLINLDKTSHSLEHAYNFAKKITERKGTFLFVGTSKQSSKTIRENAERVGAFYVDYRWLGGILTNFRTIQNSINKLRNLERLAKKNFEGYTKKEGIQMRKQLEKLEKTLGGIKFMRKLPSAIFVSSIKNEEITIKEAKKMGIYLFGIADTNVNPFTVQFPIFGNDDANKSVSLVTTIIADAIAAGKNEKQLAAYVEDDKVEIMGLIPREEKNLNKKPSYNNKYKNTVNTIKTPVVEEEKNQ